MPEFDLQTIAKVKELWSPLYGREISDLEATEILTNVTNYFAILKEWAEKAKLSD